MGYIDKLHIKGFKKFEDFEITFNRKMNVLIGENEAGKSTILEALDLTLNQRVYSLSDGSNEYLFNLDAVKNFKENPSIDNLPEIKVELFLNLEDEPSITKNHFLGLDYEGGAQSQNFKTGITFIYHFDNDFKSEVQNIKDIKNLPLEYYKYEWNTFQGGAYKKLKNPIKSLIIDNSIQKNDLYSSYAKQVFENKIDTSARRELSVSFKKNIKNFLDENNDNLKMGAQSIGIDEKKSNLSRIIDIKEGDISIQNMGKGKENLIKTEVALQIESNLILVEEPENHLSHSNTKKLIEKVKNSHNSQVILTSHSPLVVSRLDLRNTIWIANSHATSLINVEEEVARYFTKLDNMNLLEFILSDKVILVEGAAEYIYMAHFFEKECKKTLDNAGIQVISMSGITYKNYIEIAEKINKKMLIVTDNDKNHEKIAEIEKMNQEFSNREEPIKIVCGESVQDSTFERILFRENKEKLSTFREGRNRTTKYKEEDVKSVALAYMLNNKTDSALEITTTNRIGELMTPEYIKEGLLWLAE